MLVDNLLKIYNRKNKIHQRGDLKAILKYKTEVEELMLCNKLRYL